MASSSLENTFNSFMKYGIYGVFNKSNLCEQGSCDVIAMFIIPLIIFIFFAFLAVQNICKGTSDRSKNLRLGLYALLIFTGGRVSILYILLWIFRINVCI